MGDKNKDGRVSVDELVNGCRILGCNPTYKEAKEMIEELDTSGNGYIEYFEYEFAMKRQMKLKDQEKELFMDAFKKFDRNGDGTISFSELKFALCGTGDKMTDEEVQEFFKEADVDSDGKIGYEEFIEWFNSV